MSYNNRRRSIVMTGERQDLIKDILSDINKNVVHTKVYASDLDRLNSCQWWILSFALAHKEDVHITSAVVQECLRWRKSFDLHSMRLIDFINSPEQLNIYIRGEDVYGNRILWIKMNEHNPNHRMIDRLLIYWLETNLLCHELSKLTVIIDMTAAKAMDNTLVKFMFHSFKYFYPNSLADILIYNTPLKLSAAVHLFQSWLASYELPMAHEILDRHQMLAFVRVNNLPYHMNGTDKFSMDDLAKSAPTNLLPDREPAADGYADSAVRPSIDEIINAKRAVHFEDSIEMAPSGSRNNSVVRKSQIPSVLKPMYEAKKASDCGEWHDAGFFRLTPKSCLFFKQVADEIDPVDLIIVENRGGYGLQFKIKTTSPEKFRVRPSSGFIPPGETDFIRIYLQQEYKGTFKQEKFLFQAVRTNDDNLENFGSIWKDALDSEKVEKQIKCVIDPPKDDSYSSVQHQTVGAIISNDKKLELEVNAENAELRQKIGELGQRQMLIIFMLLFLLVIHMLTVVQFRSAIDGLSDIIKENHAQKFHKDL